MSNDALFTSQDADLVMSILTSMGQREADRVIAEMDHSRKVQILNMLNT